MKTRQKSLHPFKEWASLFSGKIFVKLAAYIDESGRHDKTGQKEGSAQIIIGGWVNQINAWPGFCQKWQTVLDKYKIQFFHFYEWCDAVAVARKKRKPSTSYAKNPFRGLPFQKLNSLLFELAEIAGYPDKIMVGGFVPTRDFHAAKSHPDYKNFPRSQAAGIATQVLSFEKLLLTPDY